RLLSRLACGFATGCRDVAQHRLIHDGRCAQFPITAASRTYRCGNLYAAGINLLSAVPDGWCLLSSFATTRDRLAGRPILSYSHRRCFNDLLRLIGGMKGTTWVQIIKATLLLIGVGVMSVWMLGLFGFNFSAILGEAANVAGTSAILDPG